MRILLCALSCALVAAPQIVFSHSAIEAEPRDNDWWKDRQELLNRRVQEAGDKAEIIFIGDSITQGWEGAGKTVWEKHYASRNAVNLGIGGDRTQHVLWRLDNGNLKGLSPQAAVVMIGTNNSNGEDNTVKQIADGVEAIVRKLRAELPNTKILLTAIFPRSENPAPQRGKLLMVNQIIRRLADDDQVVWVDFGHRFVDRSGLIPQELMPDYLHLSEKGYAVWAEELAPILEGLSHAGHSAESASAPLDGTWTMSMDTPDGLVSVPLILKTDGARVSGRFEFEGRTLTIGNGRLDGNEFRWQVRRQRPTGGVMVYQMSGKVDGDRIVGSAETTLDGENVTMEWTARK